MEKDKSRGFKHRTDKKKYKGNSTKDPKHVPPKSKPNLESNWDRYDLDEVETGFELTSSTDFALLANAPISHGHHFQFKSDKLILEETEKNTTNDLFRLDLNMLQHSILTVPFYNRVGIEKCYFSENQIKVFNKQAEDNRKSYNEKFKREKAVISKEALDVSKSEISQSQSVKIDKQLEVKDNKTDKIINTEVKDKIEKIIKKSKEEPVDLEDWLDDILDS